MFSINFLTHHIYAHSILNKGEPKLMLVEVEPPIKKEFLRVKKKYLMFIINTINCVLDISNRNKYLFNFKSSFKKF